MIPSDLKYTKDHEWVRVEGKTVTMGITHHAQKELGDIVFLELPDVGAEVKAHERMGTVESVKAVSDIFSPVTGKVVAVNDDAKASPAEVNQDPYGKAWFVKVEMSSPAELDGLMDAAKYEAHVKETAH
jgi:glycine cleavage system H protein